MGFNQFLEVLGDDGLEIGVVLHGIVLGTLVGFQIVVNSSPSKLDFGCTFLELREKLVLLVRVELGEWGGGRQPSLGGKSKVIF
jgi:hypothetical protein